MSCTPGRRCRIEPIAQSPGETAGDSEATLKKVITGRLLFFYVLGDVLGSGIYALIGPVAGQVGGAFWIAFALGVAVATVTGLAYAELVSKHPKAAGAALFVSKAYRNDFFTFVVTFCMLSASFAAAGTLALAFGGDYFHAFADWPTMLVAVVFVVALALLNFRGITESVKANLAMSIVEIGGLVIIIGIGAAVVVGGDADFGRPLEFDPGGNVAVLILSGAALAFFAMTGFENAANVAEETRRPAKAFPRALIGGMVAAGVLYVLVAVSTSLVVPAERIADSAGALLLVVEEGPLGVPAKVFAAIALVAVTNTCLVALVTESRILYGMAQEDVVPRVFGRVHRGRRTPWVGIVFSAVVIIGLLLSPADINRLAAVTVVFTLFIYGLVIVAALKLRSEPSEGRHFRAPTLLLYVGVIGNAGLLGYTINDDPGALVYCAALLGIGLALYVAHRWSSTGRRAGSILQPNDRAE